MSETQETLASPERLDELLKQAENELFEIQPKIEKLEEVVSELRELKMTKQRLLTLKMSLSALIETIGKDKVQFDNENKDSIFGDKLSTKVLNYNELSTLKMFHPDEAFKEVDKILKQKQSLNYEMFKAVIFNGGKASTEEIKQYLVESGIQQPQTGEGFEDVPLTEISSRANYLVRKGILQPVGRGEFYSTLGWIEPSV